MIAFTVSFNKTTYLKKTYMALDQKAGLSLLQGGSWIHHRPAYKSKKTVLKLPKTSKFAFVFLRN